MLSISLTSSLMLSTTTDLKCAGTSSVQILFAPGSARSPVCHIIISMSHHHISSLHHFPRLCSPPAALGPLCVCACLCMYACTHACMHVCMYACMHVCMYACTYICMYVYACVCMCACMCVCMDGWRDGGMEGSKHRRM